LKGFLGSVMGGQSSRVPTKRLHGARGQGLILIKSKPQKAAVCLDDQGIVW
jgi:hypothetical protein